MSVAEGVRIRPQRPDECHHGHPPPTAAQRLLDGQLVDDRDDPEKSDRRAGGPAGAHPRMRIKSSQGARSSTSLASTWTPPS